MLPEILAQTLRFARGGERLTVPLVSIVAGRRVERDLRRMFGERISVLEGAGMTLLITGLAVLCLQL